jgi:alkylation response protein AidB-like acyl-CoA dehydrogenase
VEDWEEARVPDRSFWRKAGAAGILGAGLPEEYGGPGGDFLHHVVVAEELGSCIGGASIGVGLQSDLPSFHILNFGTEAQKRRWLPKIVSGEVVTTVAMTEPNTGSDLAAIRTSATRDGDDFIVRGSKVYISGGQVADLAVVAVKTDPTKGAKGISLLLVDMNTPGLRRGRNLKKMGMKASDNVELFFDDMRVPADHCGPRAGGSPAGIRSDRRFRQAARGVRQKDYRVPEFSVCAGIPEGGAGGRAGVYERVPVHGGARRAGQYARRDRQIMDHRNAGPRGG